MVKETIFGMILHTIGESTTTMNSMVDQIKAGVTLMAAKRLMLPVILTISGSVILI